MPSSGDHDVIPLTESLAWQADYCRKAGAVTMAAALEAIVADIEAQGTATDYLPDTCRRGDFPGLRIMAVLHRLALQRELPTLAIYFPTLGGTAPQPGLPAYTAAVLAAVDERRADILQGLREVPQTNETGRAAFLRCALAHLGPDLPVRLREFGASAGLNLRADHLPGIPELESGPLPDIIDRVGCDLDPVDPMSTEGRLRLTSYVWVDDLVRYEKLRSALEIAQQVPGTVERNDALSFVRAQCLEEGSRLVIWHSAMWVYLDQGQRDAIEAAIAHLGSEATPDSPLAVASWEWSETDPDSPEFFDLILREWNGSPDDGVSRLIAYGRSHGEPAHLGPR